MLAESGIDPEREVRITPVPGSAGSGVSFGMAAAKALESGAVDAFWANGMAAEVAVRRGVGTVVVDARRGDGPRGAQHYTFPALVATEERIDRNPESAAAAVRAVVAAQGALKRDPSLAARAAERHFPAAELELIAELVRRDAPYYDPLISPECVRALNGFARASGLLSREPAYEEVVAAHLKS
jgi:ABC-type nitrate/sulfonate/bicarbonate transport system substrate-binding protein